MCASSSIVFYQDAVYIKSRNIEFCRSSSSSSYSSSSPKGEVLFFLLDNDLFPPLLDARYSMLLLLLPLLARRVCLLGSSFCRFALLVFILRRYRGAIFIPRYCFSPSFLVFIIIIIIFFFFFVLLRPSSRTTCAHILLLYGTSVQGTRSGTEPGLHSPPIEKFKELNSASLPPDL